MIMKELNYVSDKDSLQCKTAEHIFPELKESKESEDEKIRKHLITLFKDEYGENSSARFAGIKVKDIIAWFEEQSDKDKLIKELGEYKVKYTQEVLNGYLNISNKDSERLRKTTIDFLKEFADKGYENAIECIDWLEKQGESELSEDLGEYIVELSKQFPEVSFAKLSRIAVRVKNWFEKQGEQKPTDNAEPKFKVGAWITIDKPCQIISINDNGNYIVQYCDDEKTHELSKNFCESHFHIWSIKDAKDGDVLINTSAKYPFIFKQLKPSDIKTDIKNPLTVLGHCGIGGAGFTKSEGWGDTANCTYYPAAKEQRDLLFRKMYEAGYTFDFEKKELKKIEQKPAKWHREDEQNLNACLGYIPDEFLRRWLTDIIHVKYDKSVELPKGEDYGIDGLYAAVDILKKTLGKVDGYQSDDGILEHKCAISAVKKLYEQNPWSEEDEKNYDISLKILCASNKSEKLINNLYDWFKSLKDRVQPHNTWKPSKEQMNTLDQWLKDNQYKGDARYCYPIINSLYQDLKKLMKIN
jgi:hypothetical protein